jgi:hypothetical protein
MPGLRSLVVDANAFPRISSFTPAEVTIESFARMRAEERAALILQNVGRGLRGETGKTLARLVLNADPGMREPLAAAPAIVRGSEEPPVTISGADLGVLLDQARRWLEAGAARLAVRRPDRRQREAAGGPLHPVGPGAARHARVAERGRRGHE